jgi:hypothetical protein
MMPVGRSRQSVAQASTGCVAMAVHRPGTGAPPVARHHAETGDQRPYRALTCMNLSPACRDVPAEAGR